MRIVNHDYAGHPGQVYLSRALARLGHDVLHVYAGSIETPRGELTRTADDPENFDVQGVFLPKPFQKHSYVKRQFQEIEYGKLLVEQIDGFNPDVVLSGNTPLMPQARLKRMCRKWDATFVFWVMDIYGLAVDAALRGKLPVVGGMIGNYYINLEKRLLRTSDRVVLISEGFSSTMEKWRVPPDRIDVEPLWPPLDELPVRPKVNDWSREQGFDKTTNLVYAGTLGTKHNPESIAVLANKLRDRPDVRVIVISEGVGSRYLAGRKEDLKLDNLILLPFQPYEKLPEVLGTADVLLVLLEPSAGEFSVPGKVLSNLCSQRAQVTSVPLVNRAAKVIQESGGGIAVQVGDDEQFVAAVTELIDDESKRTEMAANARRYAEREFDIDRIARRFVEIFEQAMKDRANN